MDNKITRNASKSVRNGKIELLRFIFCLCVIFFHLCKYIMEPSEYGTGIYPTFFSHGSIGVEFFFLVSGFLMAKYAFKCNEITKLSKDDHSLSKNYLQFMSRKYFSIFPYHVVAFILVFAAYAVSKHLGGFKLLMYAAESLPNFLLIEMSGISLSNPNHIEWYISCMLLAMAVLYPLCVKNYYRFTRVAAPLIAIFLLGYMQHVTGRLTGVSQWTVICYKSLLRGIAEIALGAVAFEISRYIQSRNWSRVYKIIFTLTEIACFGLTMIFVIYTFDVKLEILVLMLLFVLVVLAFSSISYGSKVFNNRVCYFLGSLSLPIYLCQMAAIYLTTGFFGSCSLENQLLIAVGLVVVFTIIVKIGGEVLKNGIARL